MHTSMFLTVTSDGARGVERRRGMSVEGLGAKMGEDHLKRLFWVESIASSRAFLVSCLTGERRTMGLALVWYM